MRAKLALLWHMHQPRYIDPATSGYRMPWVFLHATKDYLEMLNVARDAKARVTFNMVPSLIEQLEDYAKPGVNDGFLLLLSKNPANLSEVEKKALGKQLLMANVQRQVSPLKRYSELYPHLLGFVENGGFPLEPQEWTDISVLYLIAWTGQTLRKKSKLIQGLMAQGSCFTLDQKALLLEELTQICAKTLSEYKSAQDLGEIEISATPHFHPILPLLLDFSSARESLPEVGLPILAGDFGEDASWHVESAIIKHQEVFGRKPKGFWPAEGSVSTKAVTLLAGKGVEWAASDEDILGASLGRHLAGEARKALYKPHYYQPQQGSGIHLFFRDKALSDLIGFTYSSWNAKAAADDFVAKLKEIVAKHGKDSVITVILDGENAWENYEDNGVPFLSELYRAVNYSGVIEFATFSELCAPIKPTLKKVHAGSWIYGSFSTWMGHPEKNRGWELLSRARQALFSRVDKIDDKSQKHALELLHAAEGSDWFWWYGDDHYTPLASEFDGLFRSHLEQIYRAVGLAPPPEVFVPVKGHRKSGLKALPREALVRGGEAGPPKVLLWRGSGEFALDFDAGAMHRTDWVLKTLKFNDDGVLLYFHIDGGDKLCTLMESAIFEVLADEDKVLKRLSIREAGCPSGVLAFSLPISAFEQVDGNVNVAFRLVGNGELLERAPLSGYAKIPVSGWKNSTNWSV